MKKISTNFESSMALKIQDLLKFVLENKYSDFYQKKYSGINSDISSYEDFQKIPLLNKDEILKVKLKKRILCPKEEVEKYYLTSGTTNEKKILAIPRFRDLSVTGESAVGINFGEKKALELNIKRTLVLWPSSSSAFRRNMNIKRGGAITIAGDVKELERSALISKSVRIDSVATTPTLLNLFIDKLEEKSFDLKSIKWITLGGEFCSSQRYEYFKKKLPNTFFNFQFGSSEIGLKGYRCEKLASEKPNMFHPSPMGLLEINNNEDSDEPGEIIYTTLGKRPFPFIRYKTGDIGKLTEKKCLCGNNLILELEGRQGLDIIKFSGSVLRTDAIEKVILKTSQHLSDQYEVHVYEENVGNKIKPKLKIILGIKNESSENKENPVFIERIIETISSSLRLGSKKTLKDLTEEGIFLPLEIEFTENFSAKEAKSKKIISHLE